MSVSSVDITGDGRIRYTYMASAPRFGYRSTYVKHITELPESLIYAMARLNAARGDDGRAEIPKCGMTRLRKDGGTHYEFYIRDSLC